MAPMEYLDFELRIGVRSGENYRYLLEYVAEMAVEGEKS